MLQLFPFLGWLAIVTSIVLLVMLWTAGDVGPRTGTVLGAWLALAGYWQFFAASAIGLALQTLLAIFLIARWRLSA